MAKANSPKRLENAARSAVPQATTAEDWDVLPIALLKADKARFIEFARDKGAAPSVLGRMILLDAMKAA